MRQIIKWIFGKFNLKISKIPSKKYRIIYEKYKLFTMVPRELYIENLVLATSMKRDSPFDIVECGVWRGGMIAGISELLNDQNTYYLFDSFEGLPKVKEIDGKEADTWQSNPYGDSYYNNCKAEIEFATTAMKMSAKKNNIIKGWFSVTLNEFTDLKILLLRLDADWYESTYQVLKKFYPQVINGGLIIIDDYYTWEGCSKAVHDYLSEIKSKSKIEKTALGVAYISKLD